MAHENDIYDDYVRAAERAAELLRMSVAGLRSAQHLPLSVKGRAALIRQAERSVLRLGRPFRSTLQLSGTPTLSPRMPLSSPRIKP